MAVADGRVWQIRALLDEAAQVAEELQRELPRTDPAQPRLGRIRRYCSAARHNTTEIEEEWRCL